MYLAPCAGGHDPRERCRWVRSTSQLGLLAGRGTPRFLSTNIKKKSLAARTSRLLIKIKAYSECSVEKRAMHMLEQSCRASTTCRMPKTLSTNPKSRRSAETREGHEYRLRKGHRSSRKNGQRCSRLDGSMKQADCRRCVVRYVKDQWPTGRKST